MAAFDWPRVAREYDGDVPTVNPTEVAQPAPESFNRFRKDGWADGNIDAAESRQNKANRKSSNDIANTLKIRI